MDVPMTAKTVTNPIRMLLIGGPNGERIRGQGLVCCHQSALIAVSGSGYSQLQGFGLGEFVIDLARAGGVPIEKGRLNHEPRHCFVGLN